MNKQNNEGNTFFRVWQKKVRILQRNVLINFYLYSNLKLKKFEISMSSLPDFSINFLSLRL